MRVDHKKKIVFIHTPKCAGNSIIRALGLQRPKEASLALPYHQTALEIRDKVGFWEEYIKLASARNPWDAELSLFFFTLTAKYQNPQPYGFNKEDTKEVVFQHQQRHAELVQGGFSHFLQRGQYPRPMMEWLVDKSGNLLVDNIIRVENINQDLSDFSKKYNLENNPLETSNTTNHLHYSHYYTEQWMVDLVRYKHRDYIDHFNYEFENEP